MEPGPSRVWGAGHGGGLPLRPPPPGSCPGLDWCREGPRGQCKETQVRAPGLDSYSEGDSRQVQSEGTRAAGGMVTLQEGRDGEAPRRVTGVADAQKNSLGGWESGGRLRPGAKTCRPGFVFPAKAPPENQSGGQVISRQRSSKRGPPQRSLCGWKSLQVTGQGPQAPARTHNPSSRDNDRVHAGKPAERAAARGGLQVGAGRPLGSRAWRRLERRGIWASYGDWGLSFKSSPQTRGRRSRALRVLWKEK